MTKSVLPRCNSGDDIKQDSLAFWTMSTTFNTLKAAAMNITETKKIKDLAHDISAAPKGEKMTTDYGVKIHDPDNW